MQPPNFSETSIWKSATSQLSGFIRISSVGDPHSDRFRLSVLFKAAVFAGSALGDMGFKVDYITITKETPPFVIAHKIANENLPTILFYSHYDVDCSVQPFSIDYNTKRLYGRGIDKGKGEIILFLTALKMCVGHELRKQVNIKVLLGGEGNSPSSHLKTLLQQKAKELDATVLVTFQELNKFVNKPTVRYYNCKGNALRLAYLGALGTQFTDAKLELLNKPPTYLEEFISHFPNISIMAPSLQTDIASIEEANSRCITIYQQAILTLAAFVEEVARIPQRKISSAI